MTSNLGKAQKAQVLRHLALSRREKSYNEAIVETSRRVQDSGEAALATCYEQVNSAAAARRLC